jgi:hypothetical protein
VTGPEHYREAERLIDSAGGFMTEGDTPAHDRCIATAQVHATLALAAQRADVPTVVVHVDGKIGSGEQARAMAKQIATAMRTAGGAL